jgi:hypothetical protein
MAEPPLTRVTLLTRLKDGRDAEAWREFVHLYGPVVYRFARTRGLRLKEFIPCCNRSEPNSGRPSRAVSVT